MSDPPPGAVLRPWTVKSIPEENTQRAAATARRRQETVADLVTRALVRELDSPTTLVPSDGRSDQSRPSKPVADWQLPLGILDTGQAPKWLRAGAARRLGEMIGVVPPTPPARPKRLRHEG